MMIFSVSKDKTKHNDSQVSKISIKRSVVYILIFSSTLSTPAQAQNYDIQSAIFNTVIGGIAGGIGAIINKKENEKCKKVFVKNFLIGAFGGAVMYGGKKTTSLIGVKHELGYAWLSRAIYNVGNSIVENAAANRKFGAIWHYDIGFIRLEYETQGKIFHTKVMPTSFSGMIYLAGTGKFDLKKSLQTGTPIFYTPIINHDTLIAAITSTNGLVFRSAFYNPYLYENIGHEIIHTYQFQDFSGFNTCLIPVSEKWKIRSPAYKKLSNWIYLDFNYEVMMFNYYILYGGNSGNKYYHNFLENEAQTLSSNKRL